MAGAALLPAAGLAALAPLRCRPGLTVRTGESAWVEWKPGDGECVRHLLPVPGCRFYARHQGAWAPVGSSLPDFNVPPDGTSRAADQVIWPERANPAPPPERVAAAVQLGVANDSRPRPTTALRTTLKALADWADHATTAQMSGLRAARCGPAVWLAGRGVPALPGGERFWGDAVLVPLGYRPDPDWPADALCEAAGLAGGEILVLTAGSAAVLPRDAFRPLTRAGVRRAARVRG
jgi:hypothetical protein